jgi:hypothetical protein
MTESTGQIEGKCPFCHQLLSGDALVTCTRCRTLYHPKCWDANLGKCGVYGCVPANPPGGKVVSWTSTSLFSPSVPAPQPRSVSNSGPLLFGGIIAIVVVFGIFSANSTDSSRSVSQRNDDTYNSKPPEPITSTPNTAPARRPPDLVPPAHPTAAAPSRANTQASPPLPKSSISAADLNIAKFNWWKIPESSLDQEDYAATFQNKNYWVEFTVKNNSSVADVQKLLVRLKFSDKSGEAIHSEDVTATSVNFERRAGQMPRAVPAGQTKYFKLAIFAPRTAQRCGLEILRVSAESD